jgi:SAM-dependent methyltransferase
MPTKQEQDYSFIRYLSAKKSVDDRALNEGVWRLLAQLIPKLPRSGPLKVLEIGAGIGTMLERMLERRLLEVAQYTGIDAQTDNIHHIGERLPGWARKHGFEIHSHGGINWTLLKEQQQVTAGFWAQDVFKLFDQKERWDLLIANAFLDLVDVPAILPPLFSLLRAGGLFYFSINYDGLTILEPEIDRDFDRVILDLYHRSMDRRLIDGRPAGDSQTGRHLFDHLRQAGAQILAAGASDWTVYAGKTGYPQDEAYFLHFIIHTIQQELGAHPQLDPLRFADWVQVRHQQIERGELVYIAHQMDFAGLAPELIQSA